MLREDIHRGIMERVTRELWKEREKTPSDVVPILHKLISAYSDMEEIVGGLRVLLRQEYLDRKDFEAATAIMLGEIERRPKEPVLLVDLAAQLHWYEGKFEEAVAVATRAVPLTDKAQAYRRHARAVLLRSASELGDVKLVRKCLREIIELGELRDDWDVDKEEDLLERAQKLGIEKDLLDRYQAFLDTN